MKEGRKGKGKGKDTNSKLGNASPNPLIPASRTISSHPAHSSLMPIVLTSTSAIPPTPPPSLPLSPLSLSLSPSPSLRPSHSFNKTRHRQEQDIPPQPALQTLSLLEVARDLGTDLTSVSSDTTSRRKRRNASSAAGWTPKRKKHKGKREREAPSRPWSTTRCN